MAAHYPIYEKRKCCPVCNSLRVSDTFCIACGTKFKEPSTKDVQIYPGGMNMWKSREKHIFGLFAEKLKADQTITPKQMKMITGYSYRMCLKFYRECVDKTVIYTLNTGTPNQD